MARRRLLGDDVWARHLEAASRPTPLAQGQVFAPRSMTAPGVPALVALSVHSAHFLAVTPS
jgi:hypothetical protein